MQFFLDDFVQSLTARRKERVGDLLREVTVSKDQIATIVARLASMQDFQPLVLTPETPFNKVSGSSIARNMRDTSIRLNEMYQLSDLISNVLDSENAILHSEIQALEQELNSLEKMADNYAFLLSDGATYNFAYLEPFNDEIGRDKLPFNVPDRASQSFTIFDQAIVNPDEGVLALTDGIANTVAAQGSIIAANASAFLVSDTGLDNALIPTSGNGWVYTLRTPNPITSSLPDVDVPGAQVRLEFVLATASPLSEIRLAPISDNIEQVVQVRLFKKQDALTPDSNTQDLLSAPLVLDRTIVLRFPLTSVTKVQVTLNQPTYVRKVQSVNVPEERHNRMWQNMRQRKRGYKSKGFPALHFVLRNNAPTLWKYIPPPNTDVQWGPLRLDRIISNINSFRVTGWDNAWNQQDPQSTELLSRAQQLYPEWASTLNYRSAYYAGSFDPKMLSSQYQWSSTTTPPMSQDAAPLIVQVPTSDYEYVIGLQNIAFGVDVPSFKGVFVSNPMNVSEQVSVVRLKTSEQNYSATHTDWDSNLLTSVEYSVSAISSPVNESDWIPIMPIGQDTVLAERFFPDIGGAGSFRFEADIQEPIRLYKNHLLYSLQVPQNIVYGKNKQTVIGLKLATNSYTANDIFTVDYTPATDQSVIDFSARGYDKVPLLSSHDNDGAGEGFLTTGDRNTAVLSAAPFIDYDQVASSTYSDTVGLLPYQPVRVILRDGTLPVNLTNYTPQGAQASLPDPTADGYYFLHSGNTLIFNKPVTQPFRVYYQYLQNTVRVRTVLRVNDLQFVSPKVDFFHLKAMTRRSDALKP